MAAPHEDFFIPRPFVPQKQEPDFRRSFWAEAPDMRPNRGHDRMATDRVCRFENGRHVTPIPDFCPHFKHEDETGFRINPSWTVQWDRVSPDGTEG